MLLWGVITMGMLHLFLLELHSHSTIIAAVILWALATSYFSLFYGGLGAIIHNLHRLRPTIPTYLTLPPLFVAMEWLKSMGQFGNLHGNLGIGLSDIIQWIPIVSIIGWPGLSAGILIINTLIFLIFKDQHPRRSLIYGIMLFALISSALSISSSNGATTQKNLQVIPNSKPINQSKYNPQPLTTKTASLASTKNNQSPSIRFTNSNPLQKITVSVIQTHSQQPHKMNPQFWPKLISEYNQLISEASGKLVIMPEIVFSADIQQHPWQATLQKISRTKNKVLMIGSFTIKDQNIYNSSLTIQPNSEPVAIHKQQLMPFGEYLPWRSVLTHIIPKHLQYRDFSTSDAPSMIHINGIAIQPLICLEAIYDDLYRKIHPNLFVVMANNAWFNHSYAGYYLLKFIRVHAASVATPALVSANFGESAIIQANGAMLEHADHQASTVLSATIAPNDTITTYAKRPWVGASMLLSIFLLLIITIHTVIKDTR